MATKAEKEAAKKLEDEQLAEEKRIGDENEANGLNRDGTPKDPLAGANAGASQMGEGEKKEEGGEKKKGKKIEVDESVLEKLLNKVEKLEQSDEAKTKELEILREVADKGRLNKADQARADGKLVKIVQLAKLGDAYVIGWKLTKDEVYTDEKGTIHEDQQVTYYLNDKTEKEMPIVRFSRTRKMVKCEVLEEKTNREGQKSFLVLTPDGLELEIGITFIN